MFFFKRPDPLDTRKCEGDVTSTTGAPGGVDARGEEEREWDVGFALGDEFEHGVRFFGGGGGDDAASAGFGAEGGGEVGLSAFDHEVVRNEVGEDVAVEAVGAGGVEGGGGFAGGGVDG